MRTNSTLTNCFVFAAGAAVGAAVAWKLLKTQFEQIAQEEIDSVKEVYAKKYEKTNISFEPDLEMETAIENDEKNIEEPVGEIDGATMRTYAAELSKLGYTNYSDVDSNVRVITPTIEDDKPFVISPDEYAALDDYEAISLTYYSDGVLADDMDYRVDDVEDVVSLEALSRFGEFEEDIVHVRNDRLKCDYEIARDARKYADVTRNTGFRVTEG